MDEQQIQENLKQNVEQPEQREVQPSGGNANFGVDIETYKLMDHFDIPPQDRNNQSVLEMMQYVMNQARTQTQGDLLDSINFIRSLESRLGLHFKGQRLENLYKYLRLDEEARRIEAEKLNYVG